MEKYTPTTYKEQSDCDILIDGAEDSLKKLENCFDDAFDDKKTKMNVVGSIFGLGVSLTKLAFNATGCAIKNAPKAVVAVAAVKREIVQEIENEYNEHKKEQQKEALDEKIRQLGLKV
ncbi:MAG: hypothetical protein U9N33_05660 [Campylobacterota bacterium]|nr:hypothetical protein [Campylobacterota bacterium]